jgi:hypothetical protein
MPPLAVPRLYPTLIPLFMLALACHMAAERPDLTGISLGRALRDPAAVTARRESCCSFVESRGMLEFRKKQENVERAKRPRIAE